MHNSNQKSSNCNKEVAPKTCHFKQTICRLQKNLIFTQFFPFSSLNLWFTHVLSRKCRKWHLRALVGSFSLKSRMVGRLDNSGAGVFSKPPVLLKFSHSFLLHPKDNARGSSHLKSHFQTTTTIQSENLYLNKNPAGFAPPFNLKQ